MGKDRTQIDTWCPAMDIVYDMEKKHRCSECNKRLLPRELFDDMGYLRGFRLPRHKKKGWKIKRAKARKHGTMRDKKTQG